MLSYVRVVVIGVVLVCSSLAQAATNLNVQRNSGRLVFDWESDRTGSWILKTDQNQVCIYGDISVGFNRVNIPKISNSDNLKLIFNYGNTQQDFVESVVGIQAKPVFSNLSKVKSAAVIYQLAPRTYFATGMGEHNAGKLSYLTRQRLEEIKNLGVDYLWLTGVVEHATLKNTDSDTVKGEAGSYYAIHDSWDVSQQVGTLDDFDEVIKDAHSVGLRVLIDLVPNHTARVHKTDVICKTHLNFGASDNQNLKFSSENNYYYLPGYGAFAPPFTNVTYGGDGIFDTDVEMLGIQLENPAKVTGNNILSNKPHVNDWYETAKLNYGHDLFTNTDHFSPRPKTWDQVVDVAKYWLMKGVDGFRVDFVHTIPIQFLHYFAREVRKVQPNAFLLAEAYEEDSMKLRDFSYQALFDAGFDSVYNAKTYWALRGQALQQGDMYNATYSNSPAMRHEILQRGVMFTNFMSNHDELRLASRHFAPALDSREVRAKVGLAYSTYSALLPGNYMIHGGAELQEDAEVFGPFAKDNGKTSIFDYVYQQKVRMWWMDQPPQWMKDFRNKYKKLLMLKQTTPFNKVHSYQSPSFIDLTNVNGAEQAKWISSYIRYDESSRYLVVMNSDPVRKRTATVHFTGKDGQDTTGALSALGISNDEDKVLFVEILFKDGFVPTDPALKETGIKGKYLYKSGGIPSGLYIGDIPAGTTYVFKIVNF